MRLRVYRDILVIKYIPLTTLEVRFLDSIIRHFRNREIMKTFGCP
uniref:Uncharacterized protein n=1 Tax=Rhizophora mucronata TaxID=61149 RepID=A0A2P2QG23_RHIMU